MIFDGPTLVPEPGVADPSDLADALQALFELNGLRGAAPPSIASAATCAIFAGSGDAALLVEVTGTTAISSFGANDAGERRLVRFASAGVVVNHSASILCPGAVNFTSEAGTLALVVGDGTNCRVWQVWHPSSLVAVGAALPPGYLFGLTLANNALDAANDIDIAVGRARSSDDTVNLILSSALTKRLDAAWAAGTDQGGLDTGTKAASTTYHVHLIGDGASLVDVLFSTSASSPTMPTGYTKRRRIGSIITDGSSNIRAFAQAGDEFLLATPPLDVNTTALTSARSTYSLTVPDGIVVDALVRAINLSTTFGVVVQPIAETDATPSSTASPLYNLSINGDAAQIAVRTNASRQIAARASGAITPNAFRLVTLGWRDPRGRLS